LNDYTPKRQKFNELAEKRLREARKTIRSLGNLAHPYNYAPEEEDWANIIGGLRAAVIELEDAARAQIRAQRQRRERAERQEGVPTQAPHFAVDQPSRPEQPWSST
jgi:hypothetical protein